MVRVLSRRATAAALAVLVAMCCNGWSVNAQDRSADERAVAFEDIPKSGFGLHLMLTNNGFGLGGHYRKLLSPDVALVTNLSLGAGKDEREVVFFDRFGRRDVPDKANYLLLLPVEFGVEKRLFRSRIEDNFRPFLLASVGPSIGWVSPYFDDLNENGALDEGETTYDSISAFPKGHFSLGLAGSLALGVMFGEVDSISQGVRFGYSFSFLPEGVQILESAVTSPQRFFGSPTVMIFFGRLF